MVAYYTKKNHLLKPNLMYLILFLIFQSFYWKILAPLCLMRDISALTGDAYYFMSKNLTRSIYALSLSGHKHRRIVMSLVFPGDHVCRPLPSGRRRLDTVDWTPLTGHRQVDTAKWTPPTRRRRPDANVM